MSSTVLRCLLYEKAYALQHQGVNVEKEIRILDETAGACKFVTCPFVSGSACVVSSIACKIFSCFYPCSQYCLFAGVGCCLISACDSWYDDYITTNKINCVIESLSKKLQEVLTDSEKIV